jgi:L-histidine N-alpha-methyltransferase
MTKEEPIMQVLPQPPRRPPTLDGVHATDAEGFVVDRRAPDDGAERAALVAGLRAVPAAIAPKYFYDAHGSSLFGAITELPEYYLTRTESALFARYRNEIVAAAGRRKQFVDLGAGDCRKGEAWLPFLEPARYVAVDIAGATLARALSRLARDHPRLDVRGVLADFTRRVDLAQDLAERATTFFYPGSSIGNFAPVDAMRFLREIRAHCRDERSGLLIGVDTRKDAARLVAAYDDAAGVTAAFNRNVLVNVNRVLGTRFVPDAFEHVALFDDAHSRIEMHLEARTTQTVVIDGVARIFIARERIHTENSYKYAPRDFIAMLERAGFRGVRCWQDDARDFAVYYAS